MYRQLLVLVVVALAADAKKLASYIKPCQKDDPNLNACTKKNLLEALPHVLKGDKEYEIPNLIPLHLPQIDIISGENLRIKFKDVVLSGLETVNFKDVQINLDKKTIRLVVVFPRVNLQGQYDMDGKILVLPLKGNGPANLTFDGVVVDYYFKFDLIKKEDGKQYINPNIKPDVKYTLKNAHYHFDNLFNGDKLLGDQTNAFLNEHAAEVNDGLGESISQTISAVVTNIIQLVLAAVPYEEIFV